MHAFENSPPLVLLLLLFLVVVSSTTVSSEHHTHTHTHTHTYSSPHTNSLTTSKLATKETPTDPSKGLSFKPTPRNPFTTSATLLALTTHQKTRALQ